MSQDILGDSIGPGESDVENEEVDCCAWAVGNYGQIYFREAFIGNHLWKEGHRNEWTAIENANFVQIQSGESHLSLSANGTPFILNTNGDLTYRKDVSAECPQGTDWACANGPSGGLFQISAGKTTLWAITKDWKCWALKGNLEELLRMSLEAEETFEIFEWIEIPGKIKTIFVSPDDLTVLAVGWDDGSVLSRTRVTEGALHGQGWTQVVAGQILSTVPDEKNLIDLGTDPKFRDSKGEVNDLSSIDTYCASLFTNFESRSGYKVYLPLDKGFLPGSEIILNILIFSDAKEFTISLHGADIQVFQFKPQFELKVVRRSSGQEGCWSVEELEGEFPFKAGQSYSLSVACEETHLITAVSSNKDTIFKYGHRFPPQQITHFTVVGDLDVIGVRYGDRKCAGVEFIKNLVHSDCASAVQSAAPSSSENQIEMDPTSEFGIPPYFSEIKWADSINFDPEGQRSTVKFCDVLYLLLTHDLLKVNEYAQRSTVDPVNVGCCKIAEILEREVNWGQSPEVIDLQKWLVYSRVQCEYPWRVNLFPVLSELASMIWGHLHSEEVKLSDNEMKKFWSSWDILVQSFPGICKHFSDLFTNKDLNTEIEENDLEEDGFLTPVVKKLHKLSKRCWSKKFKKTQKYFAAVMENVPLAALHSFESIETTAKSLGTNEDTDLNNVRILTKIGGQLISDLQKRFLSVPGKRIQNTDFYGTYYKTYDAKFAKILEPLLQKLSEGFGFRPRNFDSSSRRESKGTLDERAGIAISILNSCSDEFLEQVSLRYSLFHLYLKVKCFTSLSQCSPSRLDQDLKIPGSFRQWFAPFVPKWFDVAWYEVTKCIPKAIEIEKNNIIAQMQNKSLNYRTKFNTSAMDTCCAFEQFYLSYFWNQISWTDADEAFVFITRILNDFESCIRCYVECVQKSFKENEAVDSSASGCEEDLISNDLCLAVSNLEVLSTEMKLISSKLKMETVLEELKLKDGIDQDCVDRRQQTVQSITKNTAEYIDYKINGILDGIRRMMGPSIISLLKEAALVDPPDAEVNMEALIDYLDNNFVEIENKMTAVFTKAHSIIWRTTLMAFKMLVDTSIQHRERPEFFKKLQNMFEILKDFFFPPNPLVNNSDMTPFLTSNMVTNSNSIKEILELLSLHGASTSELILKYTRERHAQQMEAKDEEENGGKIGMLITIRALYLEDSGRVAVEILNCRRLKTPKYPDGSGKCSPYVTLEFVPKDVYKIPLSKSKTKRGDCPLFDETFFTPVSPDKIAYGGFVCLTVYNDPGFFDKDEFLGEVYVPLDTLVRKVEKVEDGAGKSNLFEDAEQQSFPLTTPNTAMSTSSLSVTLTLENRTWDHQAVQFIDKEKIKQGSSFRVLERRHSIKSKFYF